MLRRRAPGNAIIPAPSFDHGQAIRHFVAPAKLFLRRAAAGIHRVPLSAFLVFNGNRRQRNFERMP